MTESEKTQLQNWLYGIERFCTRRCKNKDYFGEDDCDLCPIPNVVEQMKEKLEGSK